MSARSHLTILPKARNLTAHQIGEYDARDFLGEDSGKKGKAHFDAMLAFRKSIKGKPDVYQKMQIDINEPWIKFYGGILFHSSSLQSHGKCV